MHKRKSILKLQYFHEIENLYITLSLLYTNTEISYIFPCSVLHLKLEDIQWPESKGGKISFEWYAKCDGGQIRLLNS